MERNAFLYALALLCCLLNQTSFVSAACPPDSHRHKTVNLGLFYTDKFYQEWKATNGDGGDAAVLSSAQGLASKLSELFSTKHFGPNSITFKVDKANVKKISFNSVKSFLSSDISRASRDICPTLTKLKASGSQTWDMSFLLLTKEEGSMMGGTGGVARMNVYCTNIQKNCGILKASVNSAYKSTFAIFPPLLAHEIGHSFGLPHDSVCNEEPCDKNGKTIMNSPGSDGAYWSKWSKSLIDRQFSDKLSYTCLKWKCGSYSPDPDTVFAHPEDVKALDAECEYNGAGIKLDKMKTAIEYKDFIEHFRLKTSDYYKVWKSNPEWYKYANICKGYPCKDPTRGALVGFSAEDVDGYPCGAGKVCKNQKCVKG